MKKLFLKDSVKINGRHFDYEIRCMLDVARETAPELKDQCVWVTSANDSKHKNNSLHYKDSAFDIRVINVIGGNEEIEKWVEKIKLELGKDYDVIFEHNPPHLHLEFDPKV